MPIGPFLISKLQTRNVDHWLKNTREIATGKCNFRNSSSNSDKLLNVSTITFHHRNESWASLFNELMNLVSIEFSE